MIAFLATWAFWDDAVRFVAHVGRVLGP